MQNKLGSRGWAEPRVWTGQHEAWSLCVVKRKREENGSEVPRPGDVRSTTELQAGVSAGIYETGLDWRLEIEGAGPDRTGVIVGRTSASDESIVVGEWNEFELRLEDFSFWKGL